MGLQHCLAPRFPNHTFLDPPLGVCSRMLTGDVSRSLRDQHLLTFVGIRAVVLQIPVKRIIVMCAILTNVGGGFVWELGGGGRGVFKTNISLYGTHTL